MLLDSETNINNRLELKQKNLPFFGETAPLNAGILMNQNHFRRYIFSWAFCLCLDLEK
jgi:mannan endo-1,4-beta-mannosidase